MSDPIDLDAMLPASKTAKLGGFTYRLPGDMPLVTFLTVNQVNSMQEDGEQDSVAVLNKMVDALVDLFAWHLPEDDADSRERIRGELKRRGMEFIASLLSTLYPADAEDAGVKDPDAEDADAPPTTPGTTTS